MRTDLIHVIGTGGHAKVVVDALLAAGIARPHIRVSDNNILLDETVLRGIAVKVPAVHVEMCAEFFHVTLGNGQERQCLHAGIAALGARPLSVIHPGSVVSSSAQLGKAVFIAANAVIGLDVSLVDGVIVNHGAVVDQNCNIAAFTHLAPNAKLGGAVNVGSKC